MTDIKEETNSSDSITTAAVVKQESPSKSDQSEPSNDVSKTTTNTSSPPKLDVKADSLSASSSPHTGDDVKATTTTAAAVAPTSLGARGGGTDVTTAEVPLGKLQWRQAIDECQSWSRLHVLLGMLDSCIKWEKSAENAVIKLDVIIVALALICGMNIRALILGICHPSSRA